MAHLAQSTSPLREHKRNRNLVFLAAIGLRLGLLLYGEYQDAHSALKYTDVDYRVFSDASKYTLTPSFSEWNKAQGWLAKRLGWDTLIGELSIENRLNVNISLNPRCWQPLYASNLSLYPHPSPFIATKFVSAPDIWKSSIRSLRCAYWPAPVVSLDLRQ